jgi:hypothetical protein
MQNDFASPGGTFDRAGIPIDGIQAIVEPARGIIDAPNRLKHQPLQIGERMQTPDGDPGQIGSHLRDRERSSGTHSVCTWVRLKARP